MKVREIKQLEDSGSGKRTTITSVRHLMALVVAIQQDSQHKTPDFTKEKGAPLSEAPSRGAEGVRTLVQLCGKLCLLHAYFPLYFRDQTGRKPTLPFSLDTLSHD
jgi:hypothetical protein